MNSTYALLYSTLVVCNAPYLPSQMEPELWRLVYGTAAARDRSMSWAYASGDNAEARAFCYTPQNKTREILQQEKTAKARIALLRASTDICGDDRKREVERERYMLDALRRQPNERFQRPPRVTLPEYRGRSFEVQEHDAYLCGMHALNNVANSVLLTPPDLLQAIELCRPLDSRYASWEEMCLAGLREGVFLLPLRLSDVSDLNPLDETEALPARKFCLELIKRAGGLVVFEPSESVATGHYVSLIYTRGAEYEAGTEQDEEDDQDRDWCVFSMDEVVSNGRTAADALDNYFFETMSLGIDKHVVTAAKAETQREKRRGMLRDGTACWDPLHFVGLLPISLDLLLQDATHGPRLDKSKADIEWLHILRTVVRRALSEMRVEKTRDGRDVNMPRPVSPGNFDVMCDFVVANSVDHDAEDSDVDEKTRFDGLDTINAASVMFVRYNVDEEINRAVDELASLILRSSSENDVLGETRLLLVQLRSSLLTLPALGLFFAPKDNFDKMTRLVSNRRWLRYLAVVLGCTWLVERIDETASLPLQQLALFCFTGYCSQQTGGVKLASWPGIRDLFLSLATRRRELLPLDSVPRNVAQVALEAEVGVRTPLASLLLRSSYDLVLWFLNACAPLPINLKPFKIVDGSLVDDKSQMFDEQAHFIVLLRRSLFNLPFENNDHAQIDNWMPPQPADTITMPAIVDHFIVAACALVAGNLRDCASYIDVLGFDSRFAPRVGEERVDYLARTAPLANDLSVHVLEDNKKPRFVERMMQEGVSSFYARTFGALNIRADDRLPITDNLDRLPLPKVPGQWMSTRPYIRKSARLCMAPLHHLPLLQQSIRESTRFALDEDERRVRPRLDKLLEPLAPYFSAPGYLPTKPAPARPSLPVSALSVPGHTLSVPGHSAAV